MKTLYLVASQETVDDFVRNMHTKGIATVMYPLETPQSLYPKEGQPLAVMPSNLTTGCTMVGWVRTVSPVSGWRPGGVPYVRLTVGQIRGAGRHPLRPVVRPSDPAPSAA